jgi:hypothetical protein
MQRGIDCRTSSQIGKIRLGEGPPPPVAIDPAKYLLLNGLLHSDTPVPARKNTTFFLQDKGAGGGRQGFPMSERRRIYRKARNAHTSRTIAEFFDGLGKRVSTRSELVRLTDRNREQWALVQDASMPGQHPRNLRLRQKQTRLLGDSAPFYTDHKILAGMLDMYFHAGHKQAFEVASGPSRAASKTWGTMIRTSCY